MYRFDDHLMIDEVLIVEDGEDGNATAAVGTNLRTRGEEMQSMMIRMNRLKQKVDQNHNAVQATLSNQRACMGRMFRQINNNIRCFGGTIEGALLIQNQNTGVRLRKLGQGN